MQFGLQHVRGRHDVRQTHQSLNWKIPLRFSGSRARLNRDTFVNIPHNTFLMDPIDASEEVFQMQLDSVRVLKDAHPDCMCSHADLIMCGAHMPRVDMFPFAGNGIVPRGWMYHHCSDCVIFSLNGAVSSAPLTTLALFALSLRLEAATQHDVRVDFTAAGDGVVANVLLHGALLEDGAESLENAPAESIHTVIVRGKRHLQYAERFEVLYALLPTVCRVDASQLEFGSGGAYGLDLLVRVASATREERRLFKDTFAKDGTTRHFLPPYHPTLQLKWYACRLSSGMTQLLLADEALDALRNTLVVDMRTFVLEGCKVLNKNRPMLCVTFSLFNLCLTSGLGVAGLFWMGKHPVKTVKLALRQAVVTAVKELAELALTASNQAVDLELLSRVDVGPNVHTLLIRYGEATSLSGTASVTTLRTCFEKNILGVEFILNARHDTAAQAAIANMFHTIAVASGLLYGNVSFDGSTPFGPRIEFCNDLTNRAKDTAAFLKRMSKNVM